MGKYTPRNPMWPDWFDGKKIDEVTFCGLFLHDHPMKCIDGRFFTPDGPVEDEAILKQLILDEVQVVITHWLSKKVSNLLETLGCADFWASKPLSTPVREKTNFCKIMPYGLYACTLYGKVFQFYGFTHYFIICVRRTLRTALFSPYAIFQVSAG